MLSYVVSCKEISRLFCVEWIVVKKKVNGDTTSSSIRYIVTVSLNYFYESLECVFGLLCLAHHSIGCVAINRCYFEVMSLHRTNNHVTLFDFT